MEGETRRKIAGGREGGDEGRVEGECKRPGHSERTKQNGDQRKIEPGFVFQGDKEPEKEGERVSEDKKNRKKIKEFREAVCGSMEDGWKGK